MPIRGEGAWGDELLMHGAPIILVPWPFLCVVKGLGHFLMYAWDQISLIRTYTALQSRSGCNRSLFMHALRSRHPRIRRLGWDDASREYLGILAEPTVQQAT